MYCLNNDGDFKIQHIYNTIVWRQNLLNLVRRLFKFNQYNNQHTIETHQTEKKNENISCSVTQLNTFSHVNLCSIKTYFTYLCKESADESRRIRYIIGKHIQNHTTNNPDIWIFVQTYMHGFSWTNNPTIPSASPNGHHRYDTSAGMAWHAVSRYGIYWSGCRTLFVCVCVLTIYSIGDRLYINFREWSNDLSIAKWTNNRLAMERVYKYIQHSICRRQNRRRNVSWFMYIKDCCEKSDSIGSHAERR